MCDGGKLFLDTTCRYDFFVKYLRRVKDVHNLNRNMTHRGVVFTSILIYSLVMVKDSSSTSPMVQDHRGYRLGPRPSYLIIAPRTVRPDQILQIHVTIFETGYSRIQITASIRKQGQAYATSTDLINAGSSKLMQLQMPENAEPGNYTLKVEGTRENALVGNNLFDNETEILFQPKRVSVFIQTDKVIYEKKNTIRFRVIAVDPKQMPVVSGSINIYLKDSSERIILRWLAEQLNNGVYESSFTIPHPLVFGFWSLSVEGWGYKYKPSYFKIENNFWERFEINITMPACIMEHEAALSGMVKINHTLLGVSVSGSGRVELEIRPPGMTENFPYLYQNFTSHGGVLNFYFPMSDIQALTHKMVGTHLVATAIITDFYSQETKQATAQALIQANQVYIKYLGGQVRTFTPGVPFTVMIAVSYMDGSPVISLRQRQVYISVTSKSSNGVTHTTSETPHIIPDDSIVKYTFTPSKDTQSFNVRAAYGGQSQRQWLELIASRQYSHSDHYITVSTSTLQVKVDKYMIFTVRLTTFVSEVFYQIVSGGNIVLASKIYMSTLQKTFALAVSRDMVPNARIVVYCLIATGEVLADSLSFYVDGIRGNGASVEVNWGKDFTRDTAELKVRAEPGSFIAVSVANYELWSRGGSTFLSADKIEADLNEYDIAANHSWGHSWLLDESRIERIHFPAPSYGVDANLTFLFAGLTVMTDAEVARKPDSLLCNLTQGFLPCYNGNCYQISQHCDGVRQCEDGADEMGCPETSDLRRPDELEWLHRKWYHLDETVWGWNSYYTKYDGTWDLKVQVPIRPAVWMVSTFSLNHEEGLSFNEIPARLDTCRPFYILVEMPSLCHRGEQIGIQVSVFNYWNKPIEAILTLEGSSDYHFINVEDGGIVSSYAPRTSKGDIQTMVALPAGEKRFIHFPILPMRLGSMIVTIHADSFLRRQTVQKLLTVEYEGITNIYHTPYFINLVSRGSVIIPDMEIPIQDFFIHPENHWHSYVPGSGKATVSLVGDVMGPGIQGNYLNVLNMFHFFEGHGDHFIFNLAVNVYWLKFLKNTDQLDENTLTSVLKACTIGYFQVTSYQQPDGGVALRRKGTPSSVWMTAHALQTLAEATESEWEDIWYIDGKILNKMAEFIVKHLNPKTGAFRNNEGPIYFIHLLDHHRNEAGQPMNITITAYVTIALAKAIPKLSGVVQSKADEARDLAAGYLARNFYRLIEPFEVCLVTYALHVTNHKMKGEAFKRMRELKRESENSYTYWSEAEIPPIPIEIVNTIQYLQPRPMPQPMQGRAIMGTAYALMVYLQNNWFNEAEPIMEWLQTQRHSEHAFLGIKDTVVALEALKEYGERITNRQLYNMRVTLDTTSRSEWREEIDLAMGNFLDFKNYRIPIARNTIRSSAKGTGLALLQLRTEINVEHPWLLRRTEDRSFDLEVDTLSFTGRNATHMYMKVCARWTRPDISPVSGAVIVDIQIPTGYVVYKSVILKYAKLGTLPIRWPRFTKQKVIWYLDYVDTNRNCWEFTGVRIYPVANGTIQHIVRIYDPNEYSLQNVTMYTTYNLFHLHMCQVCGSFQCPYCPFYNTGQSLSNIASIIICLVILLNIFVCYETFVH